MKPFEPLVASGASAAKAVRVVWESGFVRPYSPRTLARLAGVLSKWGTGPAGGFTSLAVRYPDRVGVIDDAGSLTWGEVHRRSNALARALAERGVGEGDGVAVMCRNHRGFVEATIAAGKLGADVLLLNTAFAGPQLAEVIEREQPRIVIHDAEFTGLLAEAPIQHRVLSWLEEPEAEVDADVADRLIAATSDADVPAPKRHGRIVILTSGTTGTPKGAPRNEAGFDSAIALLSRMPIRARWRTHIAAPMFHTWGLAHMLLAMLLGTTLVLRRKFDPATVLGVVAGESCEVFVVIPVMLQRILAQPVDELERHDLSALRVVASSGSALPGDLALAWMDACGDNLYNIYGSTEVAYASIATPEDLRAAPTSAGRPPWGTEVRILDPVDGPVEDGRTGRIFVRNSFLFEGYTGGGGKEVVDGLMATGDVGRFGSDGRLYVEGRDDDMIVSGGENVFPQEVEDCLARHPVVIEAAAVGVEDAEFGQRLRAFVVTSDQVEVTELQDWVRANLARFKVPREIVVMEQLPRNATGKVLKRQLHEWASGVAE